ncbi:MAG: hypothetical protein HY551_00090 [Elusimicrobia bacterium]|nr:hypothetical protein [Elusimicrobiota bacterium]
MGTTLSVMQDEELIKEVQRLLDRDPEARRKLARRVEASSLGGYLSGSEGAPFSIDAVEAWVLEHSEQAAQLAVGFARDDRDGTRVFEESLYRRVVRFYQLNPGRRGGILGALDQAGRESSEIIGQAGISEEQQREILKKIFEGRGGESNKVLTAPEASVQPLERESGAGGAIFAGETLYDRLSGVNPTGYSPQVQTYQSALNARRVPGAPRVLETGRLDYSTLAHPYYELRHDLDRVSRDFQKYKIWELSRMLNLDRGLRPEDYENERLLGDLEAAARGKRISPRLLRRESALARARQALAGLWNEVDATRDPSRITGELLRALASRQKEAARWITAASLEADLQRLESRQDFWTEELQKSIRQVPVPESVRQAYLSQGPKLLSRIARVEEYDRKALECLEGANYLARWAEAGRLIEAARVLREHWERDVQLLASIPPQLLEAWERKPYWRKVLDRCILWLAPRSRYGGRIRARQERFSGFYRAFGRIAIGDFEPAYQGLNAVKP